MENSACAAILAAGAGLLSAGSAKTATYQITVLALFGAEHTSNTRYQYSGTNYSSLNAAGQVIGSSNRYNGTERIWAAAPGCTTAPRR